MPKREKITRAKHKMPSKQQKPRLSKAILEMKFMQRTKEKVQKEIEIEEGLAMYSKEINEMLNGTSNFIIDPSFVNCEGLIEGRLSFRGMNPEIERLLELERMEKESNEQHEQPKEVSDTEMASAYYANLAPAASRTIRKKFQRKGDLKRKAKNNDDEEHESGGKKRKLKFKKPQNENSND